MGEYADFAEYYDFDHAVTLDIEFYLDFARQCGAPILELACGTGRLTIPLAEAGFEIHGVDMSANMLAVCRRKVAEKHLNERVHLSLANMASFELPQKGFVLAFVALRSFMHLLTQANQLGCLRQVYRHLHPGGLFILDTIAPDVKKLAQTPDETWIVRKEFDLPNGHHTASEVLPIDS